MATPRTCGHARGERVEVPRELRVALLNAFQTRYRGSVALRVSESTAEALMAPFGVVRPDVLERARAAVEGKKSA